MLSTLSRVLPLVGLGLALPAWACPDDATLACGQSYTVVRDWDDSDYDTVQCGIADTWPGGDFTVKLNIPAGRHTYLDLTYGYTCFWCDPFYPEPDLDLFVYTSNVCDPAMVGGSCGILNSMGIGFVSERVTFVSDGTSYEAVADEYWGFDGDYLTYTATMELNCPASCNPALAVPVTCSSDLLNQPVGTSSDVVDYYDCGDPFDRLSQPQPETIYSFTPQVTGPVTFLLSGMTHDFDLYVLDNQCDQYACIDSSTDLSTNLDSVAFQAVVGHTYYIVVEAFDANAVSQNGNYDLSFDTSGAGGCHEDCNDLADNDGDGKIDCLDPDCCVDAVCATAPLCCPDVDVDGYYPFQCGGTDCDDRPGAGFTTHPGAAETCNGRDDDCDHLTDEGTSCYDDDDDGWTEQGGDVDDADASEHPGATELCDGSDDDFDGAVDEGTLCYDDDGDCACENAPCAGSIRSNCPGALVGGDCRDGDPDVGPAESEVAQNGIDDDCNGAVDGGIYDPDGDGQTADGGDCDDFDATVYPGAVEEADGDDDDCDGEIDEGTAATDDDGDGACEGVDTDGDSSADCSDGSVPGDCADSDTATGPAASEIVNNGVDDDCDGDVDEGGTSVDDDGDSLSEDEGDCDDGDSAVHPGADEVANDADDDCDGETDEGFRDVDADGVTTEDGDCDDTNGWVHPGLLDVCDEIDNDCDGETDEDCVLDEAGGPAAQDGAGCEGCVTGGAPGGWWLAGLGLLALRRRRAIAALPLLAACSNDVEVNPLASELSIATQLVDLGDVAVDRDLAFSVDVVHERGAAAQIEAIDVFNVDGDAFSAGSDLPAVPVGGTAAVGLMYSPREIGWDQAVVTVMTDADLTPELVVHVRGHAVRADVSVWPMLVDFGPVAPGDIATRTIAIANTGDVDVQVQSGSLSYPRFDIVTALPITVSAGTTATLDLAFAPSDLAPATDVLTCQLDLADLPPIELFGNACAVGLPELYDADDDGFTSCGGDCDDTDLLVRPGGIETVDGADEDCDGDVDEGTVVWDDDGDCSCETPPCLGSENGVCTLSAAHDCADADPAIGPTATEDPDNGIDDDCDGVVDQGTTDLDADGYSPAGGDCAEGDATRYPGKAELPDGIDNDCDVTVDEGTVKYDDDGDGWCEAAPCTYGPQGGGDCDDRPTSGFGAHPTAAEAANGRDDDCDGTVDEGTAATDDDGDGFSENALDCNDANSSLYPGHGC